MFHRSVARKRIGSSPFCVRRVWSISSASLRNPPMTITARRFRRSWTRCGSQDRKSNQQRDAEDAEKRRKKRTRNLEMRKRASRPGRDARLYGVVWESAASSRLLPPSGLKRNGRTWVPSWRTDWSSRGSIPSALRIDAATWEVATGVLTTRECRWGFETIRPTFVSAKLKPPCSAFFLDDPV